MRLPFRIHRPTLRNGLRALVVVLALLNQAAAAAAHDHDGLRTAQDSLCAICVYGSGSGAAVDTDRDLSRPASFHAAPAPGKPAAPIARPASYASIRAPPRSL